MRNFEERMAEIRRRSEKILAERKKRRRMILTVCIPFVLCLGIYAVSQLPGSTKQKAELDQKEPASADAGIGAISQIQVSGMGTSRFYTDAEQIQLFCDRLDTYTAPAYGMSTPDAAPEDENLELELKESPEESYVYDYYSESIAANSAVSDYTITVTMDDGSVTKYRLTGNTLTNLTTGKTYLLTQPQLEELLQLLTE